MKGNCFLDWTSSSHISHVAFITSRRSLVIVFVGFASPCLLGFLFGLLVISILKLNVCRFRRARDGRKPFVSCNAVLPSRLDMT